MTSICTERLRHIDRPDHACRITKPGEACSPLSSRSDRAIDDTTDEYMVIEGKVRK